MNGFNYAANKPLSHVDLWGLQPNSPQSAMRYIEEGFRQYFHSVATLIHPRHRSTTSTRKTLSRVDGGGYTSETRIEYNVSRESGLALYRLFDRGYYSNGTYTGPPLIDFGDDVKTEIRVVVENSATLRRGPLEASVSNSTYINDDCNIECGLDPQNVTKVKAGVSVGNSIGDIFVGTYGSLNANSGNTEVGVEASTTIKKSPNESVKRTEQVFLKLD